MVCFSWGSLNSKLKRGKIINICFFIGKIISEIKFDFVLNSRNISIAIFYIELLNGSVIKVKGYNEMVDSCYSTLKQGMNIQIQGYINSKSEIILQNIEMIN